MEDRAPDEVETVHARQVREFKEWRKLHRMSFTAIAQRAGDQFLAHRLLRWSYGQLELSDADKDKVRKVIREYTPEDVPWWARGRAMTDRELRITSDELRDPSASLGMTNAEDEGLKAVTVMTVGFCYRPGFGWQAIEPDLAGFGFARLSTWCADKESALAEALAVVADVTPDIDVDVRWNDARLVALQRIQVRGGECGAVEPELRDPSASLGMTNAKGEGGR